MRVFSPDLFSGRTALVTGGGTGLGKVIAQTLAEAGADLLLAARNVERVEEAATASLRGRAQLAAFAGAKHALRALAQSMARELGPEGIHVAHVVIDGPIDMPWIRENFPDLAKERLADGLLNPDDIAETYFAIHAQPRSAWTFETDLRPWVEPW